MYIPAFLNSTKYCALPSGLCAEQLYIPKSPSLVVTNVLNAELFPLAISVPFLSAIITVGTGYPKKVQVMVTGFLFPTKEYTGVGDASSLIFGAAKSDKAHVSVKPPLMLVTLF